MILTFICTNRACREKNKVEQRIDLLAETVMDEQNIAVVFCPKCSSQMKQA